MSSKINGDTLPQSGNVPPDQGITIALDHSTIVGNTEIEGRYPAAIKGIQQKRHQSSLGNTSLNVVCCLLLSAVTAIHRRDGVSDRQHLTFINRNGFQSTPLSAKEIALLPATTK